MRRDTSKTLSGGVLKVGGVDTPLTAQNINGYSDWVVPSKDELFVMYALKGALGMASAKYWSSSESLVSDTPTNLIENSLGYDAEDLNSWMIDFSNLNSVLAPVQELRDQLARVRPARRF